MLTAKNYADNLKDFNRSDAVKALVLLVFILLHYAFRELYIRPI